MSRFIELNRKPVISDVAGLYFVFDSDVPTNNGIYEKDTNTSEPIKVSAFNIGNLTDIFTETINGVTDQVTYTLTHSPLSIFDINVTAQFVQPKVISINGNTVTLDSGLVSDGVIIFNYKYIH